MAIRMLIDASHPEETRVAVVRNNRVEDFEFESASRKQLKGNIYLAKVTRVEPSLQACFVDYGGNRHGFLAFSEIHPDYYQIPLADREALMAREAPRRDDDENGEDEEKPRAKDRKAKPAEENGEEIESFGDNDAEEEEIRPRVRPSFRQYKIQEVIKRRQILLVQVVKEERGNKGAALTTYLSLAGRYCVVMPNSIHGGGVSRKISNAVDRKRLKSILSSLEMPGGVGCIIRTAGMQRTKLEIKRDYEYLMRTWDEIRELTLKSIAPALIYEEGDLIKRTIRDQYSKDIEEILVDGEAGYVTAKNLMKMLMPSHAKKVQPYADVVPLFHRHQVEQQLDSMYHPTVQLKSGGYIVINPTEALVSIDVNSGRATKEHNIEETALKTNLEAAEEVARQLRLRDLAGLIVIDFIDMEERGNNRAVERKLKECLKADRARIQIGGISHFGLLEMSRQRLRPGMLESSTMVCPVCEGAGRVRSVDSSALQILRALEDEGLKNRAAILRITMPTDVAIYVLNYKRGAVSKIEERYGFRIEILIDGTLPSGQFKIEREGVLAPREDRPAPASTAIAIDRPGAMAEEDEDEIEDSEAEEDGAEPRTAQGERHAEQADANGEGGRRRRRRRRRRGRGSQGEREGGDRPQDDQFDADQDQPRNGQADEFLAAGEDEGDEAGGETAETSAAEGDSDRNGRRRRRGRRGGRNRGDAAPADEAAVTAAAESVSELAPFPEAPADAVAEEGVPVAETAIAVEPESEPAPKSRRRSPKKTALLPESGPEASAEAAPKPARARRRPAKAATAAAEPVEIPNPLSDTPVETTPLETALAEAAIEPGQQEPVIAAVGPQPLPETEPDSQPVEPHLAAEPEAPKERKVGAWLQRRFGLKS